MNISKIKETLESLNFNEGEVSKLSESLAIDAYKKASTAKILNMCLKAKDMFKKLEAVEAALQQKKEQEKALYEGIVEIEGDTKRILADNETKRRASNTDLQELIKENNVKASESRKEYIDKVNRYMEGAEKDIALFAQKVKDAEKRAQDANTRADLAEQRKKELQESLA